MIDKLISAWDELDRLEKIACGYVAGIVVLAIGLEIYRQKSSPKIYRVRIVD